MLLAIGATGVALLGVGTISDTVDAASTSKAVTIAVTPNAIITGDAVLIYGQLNGSDRSGRKIVLHVRPSSASVAAFEARTVTDAVGFYEFAIPEGAAPTNRRWFVTSPGGVRSRTVRELVASALTLAASSRTPERPSTP